MKVSSYKELQAYQKSYDLVNKIYRLTKSFPKDESYGIVSQIRRASVFVPSNIAEGYMRGSKEYIQFLKIALGSSAEVETLLSLSKDLGYCDIKSFIETYNLNTEVLKLLNFYIQRMSS